MFDTEAKRLEELHSLDLDSTALKADFDEMAQLAYRFFEMPVVLVSVIDKDKQLLKYAIGTDITETPRDIAFCAHTIQDDKVMVVYDATQDSRFRQNPLVTNEPYFRFYAGAPITTANGNRIGSVCVMDFKRRKFSHQDGKRLKYFAQAALDAIMLHNRKIGNK